MKQAKALLLTIVLIALSPLVSPEAHADREVDEVLEKFDHEPKIREVQVAAIKYYNVSPSKIASQPNSKQGAHSRNLGWLHQLAIQFQSLRR